jgi:hypothetical protein
MTSPASPAGGAHTCEHPANVWPAFGRIAAQFNDLNPGYPHRLDKAVYPS